MPPKVNPNNNVHALTNQENNPPPSPKKVDKQSIEETPPPSPSKSILGKRSLEIDLPVQKNIFVEIFGANLSAEQLIKFWNIKFQEIRTQNSSNKDFHDLIDRFIMLCNNEEVKLYLTTPPSGNSINYLIATARTLFTHQLSAPNPYNLTELKNTAHSLFELERHKHILEIKTHANTASNNGPDIKTIENLLQAVSAVIESIKTEYNQTITATSSKSPRQSAQDLEPHVESWLAVGQTLRNIALDNAYEIPPLDRKFIVEETYKINNMVQNAYLALMKVIQKIPAGKITTAENLLILELQNKILSLAPPLSEEDKEEEYIFATHDADQPVTMAMIQASMRRQTEQKPFIRQPLVKNNAHPHFNFETIFGAEHSPQHLIKFWDTTLQDFKNTQNLKQTNEKHEHHQEIAKTFIKLCSDPNIRNFLLGTNARFYQDYIAKTYLELYQGILMINPKKQSDILLGLQNAIKPFMGKDIPAFASMRFEYLTNEAHIHHLNGEYFQERTLLVGAIDGCVKMLNTLIPSKEALDTILQNIYNYSRLLSMAITYESKHFNIFFADNNSFSHRLTALQLISKADEYSKCAEYLSFKTDHPAIEVDNVADEITQIRNIAIALYLKAIACINKIPGLNEELTRDDYKSLLHCTMQNQRLAQATASNTNADNESEDEELSAINPDISNVCQRTITAIGNLDTVRFDAVVLHKAPSIVRIGSPDSIPSSVPTSEDSNHSRNSKVASIK